MPDEVAQKVQSWKWVVGQHGNFVDSGDQSIVYKYNQENGKIQHVKEDGTAVDIPPENFDVKHTPSTKKAAAVLEQGGVYPKGQQVRADDGTSHPLTVMKFSKAASLVSKGNQLPKGSVVVTPEGTVLTGKKATKCILSDPFYNPKGTNAPNTVDDVANNNYNDYYGYYDYGYDDYYYGDYYGGYYYYDDYYY